jgi:hypothetical protein
MANGAYNIMLDPSIFLMGNEREREVTMNEMDALARDGVSIHVPQVFMGGLEADYAQRSNDWALLFAQMYGVGTQHPQPETLYNVMTISGRSRLIQSFSPDRGLREKHAAFGSALGKEQPEIPPFQLIIGGEESPNFPAKEVMEETVFQEWIFLQERSWIVSRSRILFDRMKGAGGVCLELGNRALDKAARKVLSKDEEEALTRADKLRTLGKFVAVGGSAVVAGATLPPALAITLSLSEGVFALLDP